MDEEELVEESERLERESNRGQRDSETVEYEAMGFFIWLSVRVFSKSGFVGRRVELLERGV